MNHPMPEIDRIEQKPFFAVCNDCGSVKDETHDHKPCDCGGIYHVESARCLKCGTTQDPALRRRLDVETRAKMVENLLRISTNEIAKICRLCGCDCTTKNPKSQ